MTPTLAVVIPTLDEAARLPALLADLRALTLPHDTVVADGGSRDGTAAAAGAAGARVVATAPGRGRQLRAGVAATTAPWLLVVHADARLAPAALAEAEALVRAGDRQRWGAWPLRFASPRRAFRVIEWGAGWRWRLFGLAYGDQGLVLHRELYERAGGYPSEPFMEDVALARRLARTGRAVRFRTPIGADPRRYLRQGIARRALGNAWLQARFLAGVPASRLARAYAPEPPP
jgi:rSAM/selenodomain-associated transferase 2